MSRRNDDEWADIQKLREDQSLEVGSIGDKTVNELDKKLDDLSIWIEANRGVFPDTWSNEVWPEIKNRFKQAFVDAGWVQTLKYGSKTIIMNGRDNIGYVVYYPNEVMTGQEWYDKFEKELDRQFEGEYSLDIVEAIKAAKKAAGTK